MINGKMRAFCICLLVCLMLPVLASCNNTAGNGGGGQGGSGNNASGGFVLPEADFEGHEFNILVVGRGTVMSDDFSSEEGVSAVIDEAVHKRNDAIQTKYNITITSQKKSTTANQQSPEAYQELVREATAGDYTYDLCVIPGYDVSQLAYEGYLYDINALPNVYMKNSWWDQKANKTFEINDCQFFTTGDYGLSMMDQTYCIAFNKELAAQYNMPDFYQMVVDNKWTIDQMMTLSKEVSDDLDGDGKRTASDLFGCLYWVDAVYGIVNSAGQRMVTLNDETDEYELSIYTETTYNMLQKFYNMVKDSDSSIMYQHNSTKKEYIDIFAGDHALFFMTTIGKLSEFRNMETDYGILPYVLYNEQQAEYQNTVAPFYMTYMCAPLMVEDPDRTGMIMEAIGFYSQEYIMPAYYEKTLYGQYVRDEESIPMLDIIFKTRAYDLGYCYQPANLNKNLIYMLQEGAFDWSSRYARLESPAKSALEKISTAYADVTVEWAKFH